MNSLRMRIISGYVLLVVIFAVTGGFAYWQMLEVNQSTSRFIHNYWRSADQFMDMRNYLNETFFEVLEPPPGFDPQTFLWNFRQKLVAARNDLQTSSLSGDQVDSINAQLDILEHSLSQVLQLAEEPAVRLRAAQARLGPLVASARRAGQAGLQADLNEAGSVLEDAVSSHDLCRGENYSRLHLRLKREAAGVLSAASLAAFDRAAEEIFAAEARRQQSLVDFQKVRRTAQQKFREIEDYFEDQVIAPQETHVMNLIGSALNVLAGVLLVGVFISLAVGTWMGRNLSRPFERIVATIRALESGDLDRRLHLDRRDEIGQMANALDTFADTLQSTFLALATTIGLQQQTASRLRESEHQHRQLAQEFEVVLEGIPDSLALLGPDLRVVWANRGAALQAGRPAGALKGLTCHDLVGGEMGFEEECVVERCFAEGTYADGTLKLADGRTLGVKAFPIRDQQQRVWRVIRLASDMTERIQMRRELERSSRLAALGELAAGVAHEINNPNALTLLNLPILTQVFADLGPILDDLKRNGKEIHLANLTLDELRREIPVMLNESLEGARRIQRIVEDLKNFVRSEDRGSFEPFDLNTIVEAACRLLGVILRQSTDHFRLDLGEGLPPCLGRPQRLEQVVINLLQNACQALTARDQEVSLTTVFDPVSRFLVLTVADQGKGVDESLLPRLTDPFFTTRRNSGGTGLGLSISARIVQEHGGKLEFSSRIGGGTTVKLFLPTAPKRA